MFFPCCLSSSREQSAHLRFFLSIYRLRETIRQVPVILPTDIERQSRENPSSSFPSTYRFRETVSHVLSVLPTIFISYVPSLLLTVCTGPSLLLPVLERQLIVFLPSLLPLVLQRQSVKFLTCCVQS
jgi:hypothetical protein